MDQRVSDLSNFVDEGQNFSLQDLRAISEVPDVTEAIDSVNSLTLLHRVELIIQPDILSDDLRASFTKAKSKQLTNLDDGLLKHHCLQVKFLACVLVLASLL